MSSSEGRKNCTESCVPLTPMLGLMAWICSLAGNYTCRFVSIDVTVTDATSRSLSYSLGFSLFNYQGWTYLIDSGNIYYTQTCFAYADDVNQDSKWVTAQAFSLIAAVVGGIATFGHWCTVCSATPTKRYQIFCLLYLFSCLSSGLTFLFLQSNACANNPIFSVQNVPEDVTANAGCNLAWGGNLTIAGTVLWCLAGCLVCYTGGTKIDGGDNDDDNDMNEQPLPATEEENDAKGNEAPGSEDEPNE